MSLGDLDKTLTQFGMDKASVPDMAFHRRYSGYEIILLAVEIEKTGYAYYQEAARLAPTRETAEVFKSMARDELDHIKVLNKEITPLFKKAEYHWESEEMVAQYLQRSTDSTLFTDMEELQEIIGTAGSREEIINHCIDGEKKAVAFYKKVMDQTVGEEGKKAIRRILEEEKKHVEKLEKMKAELNL